MVSQRQGASGSRSARAEPSRTPEFRRFAIECRRLVVSPRFVLCTSPVRVRCVTPWRRESFSFPTSGACLSRRDAIRSAGMTAPFSRQPSSTCRMGILHPQTTIRTEQRVHNRQAASRTYRIPLDLHREVTLHPERAGGLPRRDSFSPPPPGCNLTRLDLSQCGERAASHVDCLQHSRGGISIRRSFRADPRLRPIA